MSPSGHGRVAEHFLRTFGAPALLDGSGQGVPGLRKKDLALLIYLCLEGPRRHSRSALAGLLWGDGTADKARHSLTQALRRVRSVLPPEAIDAHDAAVEWRGPLACDARLLEEAAAGRAGDPESATRLYTAHFLQDFAPGRGANEFELWADGKRKAYRVLVLQLLDRLGREAEGREAWAAALELGRRAAEIEPIFEEAQRRVMRAWRGLGERTLALEHYERFATWLSEELGAEPDPATQRLAAALSARVFDPEGKSIHGVPIRWESTDTAVAVVDSMGVVTARAPGRALIVASAGGQRADTLSLLVERRERVPLPVEDLEAPASTSPPPSPSRTPPLPRSR